jgi:hypothetical protein
VRCSSRSTTNPRSRSRASSRASTATSASTSSSCSRSVKATSPRRRGVSASTARACSASSASTRRTDGRARGATLQPVRASAQTWTAVAICSRSFGCASTTRPRPRATMPASSQTRRCLLTLSRVVPTRSARSCCGRRTSIGPPDDRTLAVLGREGEQALRDPRRERHRLTILRTLREPPDARGQHRREADRRPRMLLEEGHEIPPMERHERRRLDRDDGRRAGLAVEQRDLPEHLPRPHQAEDDVLPVCSDRRDLERSGQDPEQLVAGIALPEEHLLRLQLARRRRLDQEIELPRVERGEDRDVAHELTAIHD